MFTIFASQVVAAKNLNEHSITSIHADNTYTLFMQDLIGTQQPHLPLPESTGHTSAIELVDETQTQHTQYKTEVLRLLLDFSPFRCFAELVPCKLSFITFDINVPPPEV